LSLQEPKPNRTRAVNNSRAPSVYPLGQYEHYLADYRYFIGWEMMYVLVKAWAKRVFFVPLGACTCLALVTLMIVHKGYAIGQRGNSADPLNSCDVPQPISTEDHHFLDDLFRQQNQDNRGLTNPVAEPGQNVAQGR
jgi:hypothetical protein